MKKPMTLLEEIKLAQQKRLKTIGKKSPGGKLYLLFNWKQIKF